MFATTDLRRFRSGHHPALRRWKNLISRSEETMYRLCDNKEGSYDNLWLRCPAFDADRQRLDLGASLDELVRLPERVPALLRIILRRLGWRRRRSGNNHIYRISYLLPALALLLTELCVPLGCPGLIFLIAYCILVREPRKLSKLLFAEVHKRTAFSQNEWFLTVDLKR